MKAFSCGDIATACSETPQAIYARAKRENWPFVEAPGRGRGGKVRLYPLPSLPPDVRSALMHELSLPASTSVSNSNSSAGETALTLHQSDHPPTTTTAKTALEAWKAKPESCREAGQARMSLVNAARKIKAGKGRGQTAALKALARSKNVSLSTLYKYMKDADQARDLAIKAGQDALMAQVAALTPDFGTKAKKSKAFSPEALNYAQSLYLSPEQLNIADVYELTANEARVRNWKMGSYESLRRLLSNFDDGLKTLARQGPRRYQAECEIKILRDYQALWPNLMWCGDHHIFDVFVKGPGGKTMRPWVTAWLDMASRSFMGWCISFQPNSQTIAMALAHGMSDKNDTAFPQRGLPQSVYIDNGKDYRSAYLNGDKIDLGKIDYPAEMERFAALGIDPFYIDLTYDPEEQAWVKKRGERNLVINDIRVGGVYSRLGIRSRYATAYHPWGKPIERSFRNVVQSFSRKQPGWCGTNPQQRPEKLTWELKRGLILDFDEFCERFYNWAVNVYHQSPHTGHGMDGRTPNEVFLAYGRPEQVNPDLLDFALMKKEMVKVHNWGFRLNGREFEPDVPINLEGTIIIERLMNRRVTVFHDFEMKTARLFLDGEFICNARPLQRASLVDDDDPVMVEKLKLQAQQRRLNQARLAVIHSDGARPEISEERALLEITRRPMDQGDQAPATVHEFPGVRAELPEPIFLTNEDRYRDILQRLASGRPLSEKDMTWREKYEAGDEYADMQDLYQAEFDHMKHRAERGAG